jgi:hypothetical protein
MAACVAPALGPDGRLRRHIYGFLKGDVAGRKIGSDLV